QLDANLAENRTLSADLTAAHAELDASRKQREAIAAQLEASRGRGQTLGRNQQAQEDHVRQLETSLNATLEGEAMARELASSVNADDSQNLAEMSGLRGDLGRIGSLFDTSARAVDHLATATSIADLL